MEFGTTMFGAVAEITLVATVVSPSIADLLFRWIPGALSLRKKLRESGAISLSGWLRN
jgi:hypothetical protein